MSASASIVTRALAPAPPRAGEPGFDVRHPALVTLAGLVFGSLVVGVGTTRGPAAGLAAVLAVAAVLWAVRNPVRGAIAVVAIVPVVSGLRRGLPIPGFRLGELLAVGYAALLLATASGSHWRRWRAFDWVALAYVVATFALGLYDTYARGDDLSGNDLGQLIGPLQFFLLYRAVLVALPRRTDRLRALDWLLRGSIAVSVLTYAQAARIPGVNELLVSLTGQDYSGRLAWAVPRANGPFPHWTMLAGYMFAIVLLCVALLLGGASGRRRRLVLVTLVTSAITLILTVTIAPMLGALCGALALAWWYRRSGRALAYVAVGGAIAAIAFQPLLARRTDDQFASASSSSQSYSLVPHTVSSRIGFWTDQYLPAMRGRWLTGYGPQIPPDVTWKYTESVYIGLLLRGGLPLLALYGLMTWALLLGALEVARRPARPADPARAGPRADAEERGLERALARGTIVLLGVLAVIQVIAPLFLTTGLPHVWWILAAFVLGAAADRR
ncbi:MAG TPA: O-antigen ligase family protein [Conexibacter sp.]